MDADDFFLVTVTVAFGTAREDPDGLGEQLAGRLMEHSDVVTVRMGGAGDPSVIRVDAQARAPAAAAAKARGLAETAARDCGVRRRVLRIDVVREDQRPATPPWGVALGPVHSFTADSTD
jgi:hypothetical protein